MIQAERQTVANIIPFARPDGQDWSPSRLDGLVQGIIRVEVVTEQSFLDLGQNINALHDTANSISLLAKQVLDVISGEGGESTLHHLQLLVERYSLWLSATNGKSAETCQLLQELHIHLNELELPILGLRKVIKTLHSLRVSTRIEASKGYASGAAVLAKSLDELGALIQGKVQEINELVDDLVKIIERSIQMEEETQGGAVRTANLEVERARKLLHQFLANCLETGHWSDRLKDRSAGVAASFGEIVSALQFQDITRQRLEHVRKALNGLEQQLEKYSLRTDYSKDEQAERLFACICKLQFDQLSYAADEFVQAGNSLSENLQTMSANVMSMAADTRDLVRVSDDGSDNRYAIVMEALRSIAGYLEKTGECHHRAIANLSEVSSGIAKVAELVGEVEFIGEEMQLLAINAAISAAHARQRGAGLDIVAQNIQDVAEEACQHALALTEHCALITDRSAKLQLVEKDSQESTDKVGDLLQDADSRMSAFDASHAKLVELTSQIDVDAGELVHDISMIVARLDIVDDFTEKMTPILQKFQSLSGDAKETLSHVANADLKALFEELELCYTMASEREIHQVFIDTRPSSSEAGRQQEDEWAANRHHDLGDNVDLF